MPFEPPVTSSHCIAIDHVIWAKLNVSIAMYTPESRTHNQPNNTAPANATGPASASAPSIDTPCFTASAAAYAPRPK